MILKDIKSLNIIELLTLLILLTLPLKHSFNSISIILFAVFSTYKYFKEKEWKTPFIKAVMNKNYYFIILFIYMSLSYVWSIDKESTLKGIRIALPLLIIPIFYKDHKVNNINTILRLYVIGITSFIIFCLIKALINFSIKESTDVFFYHKLSKNLFNNNAIFLSIFVAFSYLSLIYKNNLFKIKTRMLLIAINLVFLVLLSSKNIIISTVLISIIFALKNKINLKTILFLALLTICFSVKIKERIFIEIEKTNLNEVLKTQKFPNNYIWSGIGLRVFQQKIFLELFDQNNKILGCGLQSSQKIINEKYKDYGLYKGFYGYNLHNQYSQITLELGILGLILLLYSLVVFFKNALTNKNDLYLSVLILLILLFFTESYLWRQKGVVFFVITNLLFFKKKKIEY